MKPYIFKGLNLSTHLERQILPILFAFALILSHALPSMARSKSGLYPVIHSEKDQHRLLFQELIALSLIYTDNSQDYYTKYVRPLLRHDKKSLKYFKKILWKPRPLPKLKIKDSHLLFSLDQTTVDLEVIDIERGQFKVNGRSWVLDPHAPAHLNAEVFLSKLKSPQASHPFFRLLIPEAEAAVPVAVGVLIVGVAIPLGNQIASVVQSIRATAEASRQNAAGTHSRNLGISIDEARTCIEKGFEHPDNHVCRKKRFLKPNTGQSYSYDIIASPNCVSHEQPYTEYYEEIKGYAKSGKYIIIHYADKTSLPSKNEMKASSSEKETSAKAVLQEAEKSQKEAHKMDPHLHPPYLIEYYVLRNGRIQEGHIFAAGLNPLNQSLDYFERAYEVKFVAGQKTDNLFLRDGDKEAYENRIKALLLDERVRQYMDYNKRTNIENERIQDGLKTYYDELENIVNICNRRTEKGLTGSISDLIELSTTTQAKVLKDSQEAEESKASATAQ